jgi:hypothetical protein
MKVSAERIEANRFKTWTRQIVRAPATAYVNLGGRGANFIPIGVEGIPEARFIGPNARLDSCQRILVLVDEERRLDRAVMFQNHTACRVAS